jgi:4-amino-4-deoxy-L-arabinose transferase-like glycosyltransferase
MKTRFIFLFIKLILVALLITGLFMLLASLLSFGTLASLLNRLASDGELESFTVFIYQTFRMPFALIGAATAVLTGFALLRWQKTEAWLVGLPSRIRRFFPLLRTDSQTFITDAMAAIEAVGKGGIVILVAAMGVALVMRLGRLDIPLSHDEAYMYNAFASRSIWHMVSNYHLPNNHVFLSIVMHITTRLLGNAVWTLRTPTILVGVFTIPAIYWLARRYYSHETALVSAMLVSVIPLFVNYSVWARGYIFIIFFTLLTLALGDYTRVKKNRFAWLLLVIFSALGFFTIPIMLFTFGALYIWLLVSLFLDDVRSYETKHDYLKYWVSSGLITACLTVLLYMPIIVNNSDRFFGNNFIAPLDWEVFLETLLTRLRNTWIDWTAFVPTWISYLGVLGFLLSIIFHKKFSKHKFPIQFAFLIWIGIMLIARRPDMLPRFWMFLAGPLLIWAVAGIVEPLRRIPVKIWNKWNPAGVFVTGIFILVVAQGILTIPSIPTAWEKKDPMEKTAVYLKDIIDRDDLITATNARLPALRYYFNYYDIPRGSIRQSGSFQRAFIIVDIKKGDTLESVVPKLGFGVPAVDMDSAKEVARFDFLIVYECYPSQ